MLCGNSICLCYWKVDVHVTRVIFSSVRSFLYSPTMDEIIVLQLGHCVGCEMYTVNV